MRHPTRIARRGLLMLLIAVGLTGLAINPATAREICNENASLGLADGNDDGVVDRGEIQAIIDNAGGVEGVDRLQTLLNDLPGDVTGIRYVDCAASGDDGTGTDDGSGSGDDGTGTDDGSGSGDDGTGTDDGSETGNGSGSGTGNGSGTGDGSGTGTGTGTGSSADDGTTDGGTANGAVGEIVINAEGTPVDSITGLPNTGQGTGSGLPLSGSMAVWLGLSLALAAAALGAYSLRTRSQVR